MVENDETSSDLSPFYQSKIVYKAALLPSQSGKPLQAVKEQINSMLLNYHEDLHGVPLSYSDLKLIKGKEYCRIMDEDYWLHLDITIKVLVFRPSVGLVLSGRVTMVSDSHISLLVFDLFNASITKEHMPANYSYNDRLKLWDTPKGIVSEGDMMDFIVTSYQHSFGVLNIDGKPIE